jgi:acetyl esterase/lipase
VIEQLPSGAQVRLEGAENPAHLVVGLGGGVSRPLPGVWNPSIEWLARRLARCDESVACLEVRYRVRSWRSVETCVQDAREAVRLAEGLRPQRLSVMGFSMGGGVAVAATGGAVESVIALAPWMPGWVPLERLRDRRLTVVHGSLDRWAPGLPGVPPAHSRAAFERALAAGATGEYHLVRGGVHGFALRTGFGLVPLPRARAWFKHVLAALTPDRDAVASGVR